MASTQIQVSNITLISQGKIPGIAEVKCPHCQVVNSFKVKSYLGEAGAELEQCSYCGAQIAFKWAKG